MAFHSKNSVGVYKSRSPRAMLMKIVLALELQMGWVDAQDPATVKGIVAAIKGSGTKASPVPRRRPHRKSRIKIAKDAVCFYRMGPHTCK